VDLEQPLVKLAEKINGAAYEEPLGRTFNGKTGGPGITTRLMVPLHYLKYQYNLSDEAMMARWEENSYWQQSSGRKFFEREMLIHPSRMTRWRKLPGEAGAEAMLKETIETGVAMMVITSTQSSHVTIDFTVQRKAIRYPTDARLYDRARERLVVQARKAELSTKQSYARVERHLVMKAVRYAHAR
jgi:IS5 family transposase